MKSILIIAITLILSVPAFAATKNSNFKIQTLFSYKSNGKSMMANTENLVDKENQEWSELVPEKNGVMVLGKIKSSTDKTVHLEMMVIDTKKDPSEGISRPEVVANIGEQAEIGLSGEDSYKIAIWANPAN